MDFEVGQWYKTRGGEHMAFVIDATVEQLHVEYVRIACGKKVRAFISRDGVFYDGVNSPFDLRLT